MLHAPVERPSLFGGAGRLSIAAVLACAALVALAASWAARLPGPDTRRASAGRGTYVKIKNKIKSN